MYNPVPSAFIQGLIFNNTSRNFAMNVCFVFSWIYFYLSDPDCYLITNSLNNFLLFLNINISSYIKKLINIMYFLYILHRDINNPYYWLIANTIVKNNELKHALPYLMSRYRFQNTVHIPWLRNANKLEV